jgi:hypothetical protein
VNTFETRNPKTIYTVDRGEKNLTVGSSKLVDSEFMIQQMEVQDVWMHELSTPETPKGSAS